MKILCLLLLSVVAYSKAFYFEKISECNILSNNLLQTLPELRKEYTISFKLKPNSYSKGWKSVLHLTLGNDYGAFGDRSPGIWFHEDGSGKLSIFGAISNNNNYYVETVPLPLREWSHIKIYQRLLNGIYLYSVDLNGENIHNVENSKATVFKNVKVYAGDPWYSVQDGSIKDLRIFNGNAEQLIWDANTSLKKGNLLALIPKLDKEYLVSFEVKPSSFLTGWHSVIHFTIDSDITNYGDRVPGIWFHEDGKGGLHIAAPINGDRNRYFNTKPLALNQWSLIEISQILKTNAYYQSEYIYLIRINGEVVFSEKNEQANIFENVKVYASDPWYEAQNGLIKNLYIINSISNSASLPSVLIYTKEFINRRGESPLVKGSLLGTLDVLRKEYTVSFNLKPNSYSKGWKSVLHLTVGKDYGAYGDRIPGVWFHEDGSGKLGIFVAVSGNVNYYVETAPLPLGQWSLIKIVQSLVDGKYWLSVDLNGVNIHKVENSDPRDFKNVKVYAADLWYAAQDGSIKDLLIINGNAENLVGNIDTPLVKGNLVAVIPKLDKEYLVSFDVKPNSLVSGWHSVIHFTIGSDITNYGDRVPGVWFHEDGKGGLHIAAPINGERNLYFNTKPLVVKQWSHVEISQILRDNTYVYNIRINGELVFSENNKQAQSFDNVKVYASDPWYDSQDGSIRNLFVINGISNPNLPCVLFPSRDFIVERNIIPLNKGFLLSTLSILRKEYTVSFKLLPSSYSVGWKSVIHLTLGNDYLGYGDRNPAVFFHNDGSGKLLISSAISGNNNYYIETEPLPLNVWSSVKISQHLLDNVYEYIIDINGKNILTVLNSEPKEFQNVKVYASDPWYDAQPGFIKDLSVYNGNSELLTQNDEIKISKGKLVARIPQFDKEYLVSFEVNPKVFSNQWRSVVHFTIGADIASYGDRVPGIWFHEDGKGGLHIAAPINGNNNYYFNTKPVPLNQWSLIEIMQLLKDGSYIYTIKINGEVVFSEKNLQAQSFTDVKVYAGDPWYEAQDGSIKNLYIINGLSNKAPLPNAIILPRDFVDDVSEIVLSRSNLVATLALLKKQYSVSFEVKPTAYITGWHSVIHLTIGQNFGTYGDRNPGIWFLDDGSGKLVISSGINGNHNSYFTVNSPLPLNQWSKIEICQRLHYSVYVFEVKQNGAVVYTVNNNDARDFKNVKVYASDPWYSAQPGSIKNLKITNEA